MPSPPLQVGGQAVIEGIMMRSPGSLAVVCRTPDGRLVIRESRWRSLWSQLRFLRRPFLRGGVVLLESLHNGLSALSFSASVAAAHQEETEGQEKKKAKQQKKKGAEATTASSDTATSHPPGGAAAGGSEQGADIALAPAASSIDKSSAYSAGSAAAITLTMIASLVLAMGLFKALPHTLAYLLGTLGGLDLDQGRSLQFHLLDGAIKMGIFILYVWGISHMADIRRVFMYHGAEHKAIHAFEAKEPLTVENARRHPRQHMRCGTAFLLIVILTSILFFSLVFPFMPVISDSSWLNQAAYLGIKLTLLLPIAGVAYEVVRLSHRFAHLKPVRLLAVPGLAMQRLTTLEPTDDMLEVAIIALKKTLWREDVLQQSDAHPGGKATPSPMPVDHAQVEHYSSYHEAISTMDEVGEKPVTCLIG